VEPEISVTVEEASTVSSFFNPTTDAPVAPTTPTTQILPLNSLAYFGATQWHEGVPVPVNLPKMSKQALAEQFNVFLALPYKGIKHFCEESQTSYFTPDPMYEGLTNAQVMMAKLVEQAAAGDQSATKELFDRVMGKPKQQVESVQMKLSYEDYLDELSKKEEIENMKNATNVTPREVVERMSQQTTSDFMESLVSEVFNNG
jgi:hypothetical protein